MPTAPPDRSGRRGGFQPWELDLIRRRVDDFITERRLPSDLEFDDLFQECLARWWSQRDQFDGRRGASRRTFLRKVVRATLQDLARGWRAEKRGSGHPPLSLDAPASPGDPDGPLFGELLPSHGEVEADVAAAIDLQRITARLNKRQRGIIAGVTAGMTKTALSKQFRISRDTIHEELKRIRQVFRDEGLAPHLE